MIDIVIPYRKSKSTELEWAIKSLKKNVEHRNIYVIGDDPHIDSVIYLEPLQNEWASFSKYHDQINSYLTACSTPEISRTFLASNDDFFVIEQWKPVNYNRGTIQEHIKERKRHDQYTQSLFTTARYLDINNLPMIDYDLHIPMLFDKYKLKKLINSLNMKRNKLWQIRTIYGNAYNIKSTKLRDVKNISDYQGEPLLSTTNKSFEGEIGDYIRGQLA